MTKDEILEMLKNYELYKMRAQIDNFMQRRGDGSWYQRVFELEKFVAVKPEFDVDVAIEYGDDASVIDIIEKVKSQGQTVFACKKLPENLTYKRLIKLEGGNK